MLHLTELIDIYQGTFDPEIRGLTQDSRQVQAGWLFAAIPGAKGDGRAYIQDAVSKGAVAILATPGTHIPPGVAFVSHENPRFVLSVMAARFYARQPEMIAAVTGTNGKTSTAIFTQQIWQALGYKAASIGTLGLRGDAGERYGSLTTPDPVTLHATLSSIAGAGVTHLAMEASSHGLDQHRLDHIKVKAAGFTNLTRDHLDYHSTMEEYQAAKVRLFGNVLMPGGVAVINADVPEFEFIKAACLRRNIRVWGYGVKGTELRLIERKALPGGQATTLEIFGKRYDLTIPLVGSFMLMNALCALGMVLGQDSARQDDAVAALATLQGAPGRLQLVPGHPKNAAVYVDYAHTPDALQNVLEALRPHTQNRLLCLVGCGGDRDPGKRPIMGKIAADLSDLAIITDDNPRTEDATKIRAAVMAGAPDAKEIGGRREAIQWAVAQLQEGDVLVLAGKGHEQGQIIGTTIEPFDDLVEAKNAIESV